MSQLSVVLAGLLILCGPAVSQVPWRLGTQDGLTAEIGPQNPPQHFRCTGAYQRSVTVNVTARNADAFQPAARAELLRFLESIQQRRFASRCPDISTLRIMGHVAGRQVYQGVYSAIFRADAPPRWALLDELPSQLYLRPGVTWSGASGPEELVIVAAQDFSTHAFDTHDASTAIMVTHELLGRRLNSEQLTRPSSLPEPLDSRLRSRGVLAQDINTIRRTCFSVELHGVRPCVAIVAADQYGLLMRGLEDFERDFLVMRWSGPRAADTAAPAVPTPPTTGQAAPVPAQVIPAAGTGIVIVSYGPLQPRVPMVASPWAAAQEVLAQLSTYGILAERLEAGMPDRLVRMLGPQIPLALLPAAAFASSATDALFASGVHLYVARPDGITPVRIGRADGRMAGQAGGSMPFATPARFTRAALATAPPFAVLVSRTPIGSEITVGLLGQDNATARQALTAQGAMSGVTYRGWQQAQAARLAEQLAQPGAALQALSTDMPSNLLDFAFRTPGIRFYVTGILGIAPIEIVDEGAPPPAAAIRPPLPGGFAIPRGAGGVSQPVQPPAAAPTSPAAQRPVPAAPANAPDEAALQRHRDARRGWHVVSRGELDEIRAVVCIVRDPSRGHCLTGAPVRSRLPSLHATLFAGLSQELDPMELRRLMQDPRIALFAEYPGAPILDFLYGGAFRFYDANGVVQTPPPLPVPISAEAPPGRAVQPASLCGIQSGPLTWGRPPSRRNFTIWLGDLPAIRAAMEAGINSQLFVVPAGEIGQWMHVGGPLILSRPEVVFSAAGREAGLSDFANQCASVTVAPLRPAGARR